MYGVFPALICHANKLLLLVEYLEESGYRIGFEFLQPPNLHASFKIFFIYSLFVMWFNSVAFVQF